MNLFLVHIVLFTLFCSHCFALCFIARTLFFEPDCDRILAKLDDAVLHNNLAESKQILVDAISRSNCKLACSVLDVEDAVQHFAAEFVGHLDHALNFGFVIFTSSFRDHLVLVNLGEFAHLDRSVAIPLNRFPLEQARSMRCAHFLSCVDECCSVLEKAECSPVQQAVTTRK